MDNVSNKNYRNVYFIRNRKVHANNVTEKMLEPKVYNTVELYSYNKKKNQKKKTYELIFYKCNSNKFPACTIKSFTKQKIKSTCTKTLFQKFRDATNKINKKFVSLLKIYIIKENYFSNILKIKNKITQGDYIKYLNLENDQVQLNYSNYQKPSIISSTFPKKKLRENCCKSFMLDRNSLYFEKPKKEYYEKKNTNIYRESSFIKHKDLNAFFNQNVNDVNKECYNDADSKETTNKLVTSTEKNRNRLQNTKNFYVSVINKKTNIKKRRKLSLIEIRKDPHFYICENFLTNLEVYLALNHCLLYIKKNNGKMSKIHDKLYSVQINVDDVSFLEENISVSILRHIFKRLNSLFQIPIKGINSIEFGLYLKGNDKEEPINFIEKGIHKYSLLIILSYINGNYIEFSHHGIRIMTIMGNCLIYECSKNNLSKNIFNFDISEEKIYFLKLNIIDDLNLHGLFENKMNTNKNITEFFKKNKLEASYEKILTNKNIYFTDLCQKNNFNTYNADNLNHIANYCSYIKNNIDRINEKIMEINMNHLKILYSNI